MTPLFFILVSLLSALRCTNILEKIRVAVSSIALTCPTTFPPLCSPLEMRTMRGSLDISKLESSKLESILLEAHNFTPQLE